jgi:hypothetical protein
VLKAKCVEGISMKNLGAVLYAAGKQWGAAKGLLSRKIHN